MAVKSNLEAVRDTIDQLMAEDASIMLMGEDVEEGGVFRATEGLLKKYGRNRIMDTPLAESSIVGVSIGASLNGLRPIAEIQFADFILPAVNQIISEAAKFRYRSAGDWSCPLVIRAPYGGGIHGGLYHSQSLEQLFTHQPGLKVVAPCTPYDMKGLLRAAVRDPDPVIYFEHKRTYRLIRGEVPDEPYEIPIGKAEVRREGGDLTVFSYGLAMHMCLEAAETLASEDGVQATVVDLRTLSPLDRETILETAKATGKILIVHEDNLTGGLGGEIAALIAEHAFDYLDGPIMRLGGPDVPAVPFNHVLEAFYMPSPAKIAAAMRTLAAY
ncbi:MAG TPA: alpha-ketoacid dehydrogenase subunit beta [Dehalococcoidia bacterium]|nr:alpha-ketoacid dehydrogenase subunit beta [Dehalococcoidia bacterium]